MKWKFADNTNQRSIAYQFRFKRFLFFRSLLNRLQKPVSILDIGGTQGYWDMMGFSDIDIRITLLNLEVQPTSGDSFTSVKGDATDLSAYADQSFDIVYSNSVIEHLFTYEAQLKMANEVRRVGKNYFIQTPNYYFPIEPHWVFPFFQFLPVTCRVWMTRNLNLGHIGRIPDPVDASKRVAEVQLLTRQQMQQLFPQAKMYQETFFGLTKSLVAYKFD
ncbi:MAG: class I SAM-dependent methyltransferase [Bacteroidota bacterium]